MENIKVPQYKEIRVGSGVCDFCQCEVYEGYCGSVEVAVPLLKCESIIRDKDAKFTRISIGEKIFSRSKWGYHAHQDAKKAEFIKVGETTKIINPLICKSCILLMAKKLK